MLYGFPPGTQWAAIAFYEKASGGMICEDYERHPPNELRRISTIFSSPGQGLRRPLTASERKLSMRYRGGQSWIKVTFDSFEAAERACQSSPHLVQGHWMYADLYANGIIPNNDEPIPLRPEDRPGNLSTATMPSRPPSHKMTQSFGPASSRNLQSHLLGTNPGLTEMFGPQNAPHSVRLQPADGESGSPATASSATATAPDNGTLHRRDARAQLQNTTQNTSHPSENNTRDMKFFSGTPRTILRPESEAFLPQPSWAQKMYTYLKKYNILPGDIIGHVMPRTESGEFDLANASFYWRLCYCIDCYLGTDICGLKEE